MSNFTYLHLHTRFSRNGGPAAPADWCRRAVELGYTAIGVADRAPLVTFPSMFAAARQAGLTPLLGMEMDILLPTDSGRKAEPVTQPVLLFARSRRGALNLAKIASQVYAGWPGTEKPLAWDALAADSVGLLLIVLGGDEAGALTPFVTSPARKLADWGRGVKTAFPDAAFVGLPHSGRDGDNALAAQVASAAGGLGLPTVAIPTARYLRAEDAPSYEALKAARIRAGWPRDDTTVASTTSIAAGSKGHDYLRSPEEASALFSQWPDAVENVRNVAGMCSLCSEEWPFGAEPAEEEHNFLRDLAEKRLLSLLSADMLPHDMRERLDAEARTINSSGREGAWIALASIADMAKEGRPGGNRVPIGAPLGSAAGSLFAFALGIAPLNPVNDAGTLWVEEGEAIPVPGLEVPDTQRDPLVWELAKEYGPGRLAQAACALPVTPSQAVQASATVLGITGETLKSLVAATIEKGWDALTDSPDQTAGEQRLAALALSIKDAPLTFTPDPDTLLAAPRQTHGADTLASYGPILTTEGRDWLPWAEEEVCALPYPAFSLRPTRELSALDAALSLARRFPTPGFQADAGDLSSLPPLGEEANNILRKGELAGVPYLAAPAAKEWTGEASPDSLAQLVARSLFQTRPPAPDPRPAQWDEVTAATGGALLFKDQLVALLLAFGASPAEIPTLRRLLGHPGKDEANAEIAHFVEATGLAQAEAESLLRSLADHARVLVHNDAAAAWGRTALWSVALKAGHMVAHIAGALSATRSRGRIAALAAEAHRLGAKLEPPDINLSAVGPTLQRDGESWAVLWGLSHLPGWHVDGTTRFLDARPGAGFASLKEVALAALDAGLSATHIEMLIRAGACDTLGAAMRDRQAMLAVLPAMFEWAQATRHAAGQMDLFTAPVLAPPVEEDLQQRETRPTISNLMSPGVRRMQRTWEEDNIGVAFTGASEMDELVAALEKSGGLRARLITTAQINESHVGSSIYLVGLLCSIRMVESGREGEIMCVASLEDAEGSIELVAFPPNYKRQSELWEECAMLVVTARVSKHDDGEIYLLSEHLAPFRAGAGEEAMTLTIKASRSPRGAIRPDDKPTPTLPGVSIPVNPTQQPVAAAASAQPPGRSKPHHASTSGEQATYSLVISIPPADDDHTVIDSMIALNGLLGENPGPDDVSLRVQYSPQTGKWTSARLPAGVRYSHHLEQSIRHLLGDDALAVIKLLG